MAFQALLLVATLFSAFGLISGCAFPPEGCLKAVCKNYKSTHYADLLDAEKFTVNDKSAKGDWSPSYMKDLGYFFNVYNPLFNKGKYDPTISALKGGAPALNWFTLRSTRGTYADQYSTLSECCSGCASTPGCKYYIFNPYYNYEYDDDDNVISRSFDDSGEGECYLLIKGKNTYGWLEKNCVASLSGNKTSWFDPTFPVSFYGGACNADAEDDPHFIGARGTRFDWNGDLDKSFCLVTDTRMQINTIIRGYKDPRAGEKGIRSWMKELGFIWVDEEGNKHTLHLAARAGKERTRGNGFLALMEVDGVAVAPPSTPGASFKQGGLTLDFLGVAKRGSSEVEQYRLTVGDLLDISMSMRVAHALLQTPTDSEVHFNLVFNSIQASEQVHGVLGQTYKSSPTQRLKAVKYSVLSQILGGPVQADGTTGKGFLEGGVADYQTSSVVSTDCKFSSMV